MALSTRNLPSLTWNCDTFSVRGMTKSSSLIAPLVPATCQQKVLHDYQKQAFIDMLCVPTTTCSLSNYCCNAISVKHAWLTSRYWTPARSKPHCMDTPVPQKHWVVYNGDRN